MKKKNSYEVKLKSVLFSWNGINDAVNEIGKKTDKTRIK